MSIAGIRSNRGDIYQTLIAFDWALTVLSDSEFEWLEIDSTTYLVDDVVIAKSDGTLICCQCKKNQADFSAWSIADLADELDKASLALARNQQAKVRFYSRSEFGSIAKIREYSMIFGNETDYRANLSQEHIRTDAELTARIAAQAPGLSTYEFLCRTSFEISPDYDRIDELLRERLRQMASNSGAAFNALWVRLDKLGGRLEDGNLSVSTQHRLTKDDLKDILYHAGAMLVPPMSIAQLRASFSSTSAIGRSWIRDIVGQSISSPIVNELLAAIDAGKRSILLTGLPGSGKTCVMLNLQETLENRARTKTDIVPLFIQSREFADFPTAQERQAQGLPEKWVEQAARLAEYTHVVVVIDSLDVLSIAREHSVLTYFLAQIDQLLLIPNVTVITACRDFDRKYDRRIAARQWDCEFECLPLDWETEIAPLLEKLAIDTTTIDHVTRELIRNPRELALFVELARREGSFNVVTSQALAQRYLDTIVESDPTLGDTAMQAIECIANEMLLSRTLSIPRRRFSFPQDILRRLQSLNVLQDTHDGKLTFGHQTLLDVLVICGAVRAGVTLNRFIQSLPPVPFVRPSIRSFVAQLATGDRREFKKQIRAVLTGDAAFHIRRLVAESFAQQMPQDDDWPMIRELREKHHEVFQVIYTKCSSVEWHHFWLSHLVPTLKEMRDAEGMITHARRVTQWKNEDASGISAFWIETVRMPWLDGNGLAQQLFFYLSDFNAENYLLIAPLLDMLLNMPRPEHSIFGHVLARGVSAGIVTDRILWNYIAGDISEDDIMNFNFDKKLHCRPNEFGDNENFLKQRMVQSTTLLNLALESIEQWSQIKSTHFGETRVGYRHGYLSETSYNDTHSQHDHQYVNAERSLFDAVEEAILYHAQNHSEWWQQNRERLCFNQEGALCYFAIIACTNFYQSNIELIGRLLCDRNLLEFELSYELSTLIQTAFIHLDYRTQDSVMATIQNAWDELEPEEKQRFWILKQRAKYTSAIPCHQRSQEIQTLLDSYQITNGTLIRQPTIHSPVGRFVAPFSFEAFLTTSDEGVIRLLTHYAGYKRNFDDDLIEGERQVGSQLREASSRHPSRFLRFLVECWGNISASFRDDIMDGIATYLAHRYGNLQPNDTWAPVEEPDALALVNQLLDELERHLAHWQLNRSASKALEACAHVIQDTVNAARLVFLSIGFGGIREKCSIQGDSVDLINIGINMVSGNIAESLMILANKLQEHGIVFPELLPPALRRFARNEHPAIRALVLRRLPYLQYKNPELGWELFHLATQDTAVIWKTAESCLYHSYHEHFEKVGPLLERIRREGDKKDMETWGRISALSALTVHLDFANLLRELSMLDITEAWQGAASVWTHTGNIRQHREQCLAGIETGLNAGNQHATTVARLVKNIYRDITPPIKIPIELINLFFCSFERDSEYKHRQIFGFCEWLNAISKRDIEYSLAATEIYLAYISRTNTFFYDHENLIVQLITRFFAEAEEREETDSGAMLKRVVALQDILLLLGVTSVNDWLQSAERQ
jgi:hypothetical protein